MQNPSFYSRNIAVCPVFPWPVRVSPSGVAVASRETCKILSTHVWHTSPRDPRRVLTTLFPVGLLYSEPSEAPSRVRARAVSSSEIEVHWEAIPPGSGGGKILAYEVRQGQKK